MTRDVTYPRTPSRPNRKRRGRVNARRAVRGQHTQPRQAEPRKTQPRRAQARKTNPRKAQRRGASGPKPKWGWAALLGLVGVNVGVVLYHGDPRVHLPEAHAGTPDSNVATKTERPAADAAARADATPRQAQAAKKTAERHAEPKAADSGRAPPSWMAEGLNPLLGVRTPGPVKRVRTAELGPGQTLAQGLAELGIERGQHQPIVQSFKPLVDFRKLRPGHRLKARFGANDQILSVDLARSRLDKVRARYQGEGRWSADALDIPVDTVTTTISGEVDSSLWNAMAATGERPTLALALAQIFAWEIDFYTGVYPGDSFKVLVEKRYVDGEFLDYGHVLAAEFVSDGHVFRGFMHEESDGTVAYYDKEGRSLRKQLLKSPLKFGHITSRFGRRHHPVLGYTRAHNGVDYGVRTGTPVRSVGDGRVIRAGWAGGFGRLIEIRHANGWVSQYAHLSEIAVRKGQRVSQKQKIGRTGASGLATGPHLHYGLKKVGRYVDPLAQDFERAEPLRGAAKQSFRKRVARLGKKLEAIRIAREPAGHGQTESANEQRTDVSDAETLQEG